VDKNGDLNDGTWVEVNQFKLVEMEKTRNNFAGGKTETPLKTDGHHHNFFGVSSGDFFIFGRLPLEYTTVREKVFLYKLEELILINKGQFRVCHRVSSIHHRPKQLDQGEP
jgi:hypothetical protein